MPEYWNTEAERNVRRPIVTYEQREQIAELWAEDLQPDLRYCLANSANLDEFHPAPVAPCPTLRVNNLHYTVEEADLHALFEPFGIVTSVYLAPNGYFAFVNFADRADAVRACQRYDGFCYKYMVMRVEFVKSSGDAHARSRLWLEYPDDGEFVSRDPPLRATVELQRVAPTDTYVTIVISTSWELKESRKHELEDAKKRVLGSTLGARVFLAYDSDVLREQ
ncbi:eukaryotic translation initiation factor 3 [Apiospora sp. TS-2023a]